MRMLVTGATGTTGARTIDELLARGHRVRALVHHDDARAAALRERGVEVVRGDLLDLASVTRAVEGVDTAYFCYPIEPGLVEATAIFAQAARSAGVRGVVNMSQVTARRDSGSRHARQHWISERILEWSSVPVTHLHPPFFAEWLLWFADAIAERGVLPLPFGEGRHAPIAAEDQARVIAAVLEDPAAHAGRTYRLTGPVEMTYFDVAAEAQRVLGRPVRYQPVEIDDFAARLRARGRSEHLIQHLSNVAVDHREGRLAGTTDVVQRVGRSPGTTIAQFVEANRAAFNSSPKEERVTP